MTEPQAAKAVGIHPSTLRRWRKNGAVGFTLTPGGRVRYSPEDIRRLVHAAHIEPTLGKPVDAPRYAPL
jgi:predicted site-specific integrase-resolvase